MKISGIYLFTCVNLIATIVAHYRKCYDSISICLITHSDDDYLAREYRYSRPSANNWCKDHSSSLAIITNETVQSAIEEFINDSSAKLDSDVITNGYRYIESSLIWTNGISSGIYTNTNSARYAYLVVSTANGIQWSANAQATFKKKFICSFLNSNSSCPHGHLEWKKSCYKFHHQNVTWYDARNICLKEEGSDLATFDDLFGRVRFSLTSEWHRTNGEYWIGLRTEIWAWLNSQTYDTEVKYSNWEDGKPNATDGDCLCLRVRTGKWTDCDCTRKYYFICIQDTSHFQSTPTQMYDDNLTMNVDKTQSGVSSQSSSYAGSQRLITWVPLALLIVLIAVMAVVSFIVIKKLRKRNMLIRQGASSMINTGQPASPADAYATLKPEYLTANGAYDELDANAPYDELDAIETYDELDVTAYETIEDENQENSN